MKRLSCEKSGKKLNESKSEKIDAMRSEMASGPKAVQWRNNRAKKIVFVKRENGWIFVRVRERKRER